MNLNSILIKNGIKIYPEVSKRMKKFAVCIEDEYKLLYSKKTCGKFKHDTKTINKALEEMREYTYENVKHKL